MNWTIIIILPLDIIDYPCASVYAVAKEIAASPMSLTNVKSINIITRKYDATESEIIPQQIGSLVLVIGQIQK